MIKSIGEIIKEHRLGKNMTQEELGNLVFVSKQAVSKWENGRTLPDVEMIRRLCNILEISKDEILGESVEQIKKSKKWIKLLVCMIAVCAFVALFFALDGFGYIERNTQSGVAYLSVFQNGEPVNTERYSVVSDIMANDFKNGYKFDISYGEVRGTVVMPEGYEIEYGFFNTNNWHNIQIRLDVEMDSDGWNVRQTITYATDGDTLDILVTESSTETNKKLSVFRGGV